MTTDMTPISERPHALVINGKLYAYGDTYAACRANFSYQVGGCGRRTEAFMFARAGFIALDDETASEVAECIAAPVLAWE